MAFAAAEVGYLMDVVRRAEHVEDSTARAIALRVARLRGENRTIDWSDDGTPVEDLKRRCDEYEAAVAELAAARTELQAARDAVTAERTLVDAHPRELEG